MTGIENTNLLSARDLKTILGKTAVNINGRPSKIQETLGMLSSLTNRDVNVQDSMDFVEIVVVLTFFSSINLTNEAYLSTS